MLNNLKLILKQLEAGEFNEWAGMVSNDFIDDDITPEVILSIVKDFIACRIIEQEEELKK